MNSKQDAECNSAVLRSRKAPADFPKAGISPLVSIPGAVTACVTFSSSHLPFAMHSLHLKTYLLHDTAAKFNALKLFAVIKRNGMNF